MKTITNLFLTAVLSLTGIHSALAEDGGALAAENFSSTLTFTSNYTFRGTTFSDGDPAIQGSFDWGHGAFFAGAWGSSTAANEGSTFEIDVYAGWADNVGGFDLMVMPLIYTFPGQRTSKREDFTFELWTSIGRSLEGVPGSPYVNVEFNWSPELFDNGDNTFYIRPSIGLTLPNDFGIDAGYGYQDIGDKNDFFGEDYSHIDVGITKSIVGFDLDLRYHHNFKHDELDAFIGVSGFALDSEIVFTVARSF